MQEAVVLTNIISGVISLASVVSLNTRARFLWEGLLHSERTLAGNKTLRNSEVTSAQICKNQQQMFPSLYGL